MVGYSHWSSNSSFSFHWCWDWILNGVEKNNETSVSLIYHSKGHRKTINEEGDKLSLLSTTLISNLKIVFHPQEIVLLPLYLLRDWLCWPKNRTCSDIYRVVSLALGEYMKTEIQHILFKNFISDFTKSGIKLIEVIKLRQLLTNKLKVKVVQALNTQLISIISTGHLSE